MKKFITMLIIVILIAVGGYIALNKTDDKGNEVIATVNGQEIRYRRLAIPENFLRDIYPEWSKEELEKGIMRLRRDALRRIIEGTLIQKEIERRGIAVLEEELRAKVRAKARKHAEIIYGSEEARRLHREMFREELTLEGLEQQHAKAPDVKGGILKRKLFELVLKDITVSEEEIRNYYESLPLRENQRVKVKYFWHQDRSVIEAVQRGLKAGVDGKELLRKYKLYPDHGGGLMIDLALTRNMFSTEEDLKVLKMSEGEISEVAKVKIGDKNYFQVIQLLEVIEVKERRPFEEMKERIRRDLSRRKKVDVRRNFLEKLWKEADIRFYFPEYRLDDPWDREIKEYNTNFLDRFRWRY